MNNVLLLIVVIVAVYMVCVRAQNQITEPFDDNPLKMINHNEFTTPCCRNVYKVDQNREDIFSKNPSNVYLRQDGTRLITTHIPSNEICFIDKVKDKYFRISFPTTGEYEGSKVLVKTNKDVYFKYLNRLEYKDTITYMLNLDEYVEHAIIQFDDKQLFYEIPKNKRNLIILPKLLNKNYRPLPTTTQGTVESGCEDPFTDRKIFSKYPYIDWETPRYWKRFDNIRY